MLKPDRTHPAETGVVFFAMPFGTRPVGEESCDFDAIYTGALVPAVQACGMKPERLDNLYGPQGVLELIWWAIQRAEIVVIDFSLRNANVTFEYGLAWTLGKRIVALTQNPEDIPSDVRGLNRYIQYSQRFTDIERMKHELTLQLEALRDEPADERAPMPYIVMGGGGMTTVTVPATVTGLTNEVAFVKTDDGRLGFLRNSDVEYARLIDMTRRYSVGDRVDGAFLIDPQRGEARYTLLAGQTNPWTVLAPRFPIGTVFTGVVRRTIEGVGVFVRLDGDVNGLIPATRISGAFPLVGDSVEVVVTKMDPVRRKVTLRPVTGPGTVKLATATTAPTTPAVHPALPSVGHRTDGTVVHIAPERDGRPGYLLLQLPGFPRAAKLPAHFMSEDLRADLGEGQVELGEEISIEVASVDPIKNNVVLRELPEPVAAAA